jgi:hypothetical protein
MLKLLPQNLLQAQNRMKKFADANRIERTFEVGEFVYLKMQPYLENALGLRNSQIDIQVVWPFSCSQENWHCCSS